MNLKERYVRLPLPVKAAIWFTICSFMQKAVSILSVPLFTRILTTEEYGVYTVFTSWQSVLSIFATLNLSYYVFNKGMVKYEDDRDTFVFSLQSLGTLACLVLFVIYFVGKDYFNNILGLPTGIVCLMFLFFLTEPSINYWSARQRFEYKYKKLVAVTFAISVLNPILGFALVKFAEDKAFARVLSVVLVSALFGLWFYCAIVRKANCRILQANRYWKYALNFNLPLIPHFLSSIILSNVDRLMIDKMCGKERAAIYGVAYSAAMLMILVNNALHQSILPWLYPKMKRGDCRDCKLLFNGTLLLVATVNLMLIAFSPEIIAIMAPSSYSEAIWVIPPVAASVYFMFLYSLFSNVEMYFEESRLITIASVGVALLNIVLNYIFINRYGYMAAGYTTLFCYVLFSIVHYIMMRYVCKRHTFKQEIFDLKTIIAISIGFIAIVSVLLFLYNHVVLRWCFIMVLFGLVGLNYKRIVGLIVLLKKEDSN